MDNKGFTLVEVLAVVVILGLIGVITVPNVLNTLDSGKRTSDKVLYENIKTAAQSMYEEIYYGGAKIYSYTTSSATAGSEVSIGGDSISTNIQTLVGNGFLTGVNNSGGTNANSKIVLNSKSEDLGMCEIKIAKITSGNKICYKVEGSDVDSCPTTDDFGGSNQCS